MRKRKQDRQDVEPAPHSEHPPCGKILKPLNAAQDRHLKALKSQTCVFATGPAGTGKAQPLDAKIRIPGGWMAMGDAKIGSTVIAPDGSLTEITGVYPQGEREVFRITFDDGRSTECCAEHLWEVYRYDWCPETTRWRVVTLADIQQMLTMRSVSDRLYVRLVDPDHCDDVDLPIHPYLLGVLLGDGHLGQNCVRISNPETEILDAVSALLPGRMKLEKRKDCDYAIVAENGRWEGNPLLTTFRELGLAGKLSHEKTIPEDYLNASAGQRRLLLQGLMDTDGTVSKGNKTVSFCSTSKNLADGVQYLVRSLGGLAKISTRNPSFTYLGERKQGRIAYQVNIRVKNGTELFRNSQHKLAETGVTQYSDSLRLRIVSVESVGRKETQCISVKHKDQLYVTDDFITTHNTYLMAAYAAQQLRDRLIDQIVVTRPTVEAGSRGLGYLKGTLQEKFEVWTWGFLRGFHSALGKSYYEYLQKTERIIVCPLQYAQGMSFGGPDEHVIILADEFENATRAELKMLLTRVGENAKIFLGGDTQQIMVHNSGFRDAIDLLRHVPGVAHIEYTTSDIVRSDFVRHVLEAFEGVDYQEHPAARFGALGERQ